MTEVEALEQAAERYRTEGYAITLNPAPEQLPEELRRRAPGFVARQNGKSVLVEVWTRGGSMTCRLRCCRSGGVST